MLRIVVWAAVVFVADGYHCMDGAASLAAASFEQAVGPLARVDKARPVPAALAARDARPAREAWAAREVVLAGSGLVPLAGA